MIIRDQQPPAPPRERPLPGIGFRRQRLRIEQNSRQHILRLFRDYLRVPPVLTMREWAEQNIVIPTGPFRGLRFSCDRQPFARLFFDEVDSGRWAEIYATGPTQTGKTLLCFAIPTLYWLFERRETTIVGLPDLEMASDKWNLDLKPVVEASPVLRRLLPDVGEGSRGGDVKGAIKFLNGAALRFMSRGGSDKRRAHFTARAIVATEINDFDNSSKTSEEADPWSQITARSRAFGSNRVLFGECTQLTTKSRINVLYQAGTASRILLRCPHCEGFVTPEREHLRGWQEARDAIEARELAHFICPACESQWSEEDRREAHVEARLLHRGQEITEDGQIIGDPPRTEALGFRWSAVNSFLNTAGDIGRDEWIARQEAQETDSDSPEKRMHQFVWAKPFDGTAESDAPLDQWAIARRLRETPRGVLPAGTQRLTVHIDVGKHACHWAAIALDERGLYTVVDFDEIDVPSRSMEIEAAIEKALSDWFDEIKGGWAENGKAPRIPDMITCDARYKPAAVASFCRKAGREPGYMVRPSYGDGTSRDLYGSKRYLHPKAAGGDVRHLGDRMHSRFSQEHRLMVHHVDADAWKTKLHQALSTPLEAAGSLGLYRAADPAEHLTFARHMLSETQVKVFDPAKGWEVEWQRRSKQNHYFDATYQAFSAHELYRQRAQAAAAPANPTESRRVADEARRAR